MVLATFKGSRSVDLIFYYVIAISPYMPNLGSISHPLGLEEALVVR